MKRLIPVFVLVFLLVGVVIAACGESSDEGAAVTTEAQQPQGKATVLRLAIPNPPEDAVTVSLQKGFVDLFNERAAGRYVIEPHPSGALVSMGDSFEAVRTGTVEMADWAIGVFGSIDPVFNLAELPFAVNGIEADAVYCQRMRELYDGISTEKYNMKCLLVGTLQGLEIISIKPVKTLEDWKGLLCQTISPATAKVIELLGGSGVAIDFSEAYTSMQKKVIEASPESSSMILGFSLYEVADYLTKVYLTPTSLGLWINLDVYNEMPDDIRQILDECGEEGQKAFTDAMFGYYEENFTKLAELGMDIYPLPAAERSRWMEKVKPFSEEVLGGLDPAIAEEVKAIISELDKQFPYQE